jgi:8-hydroxy-5-deazaflavin:NADPH oxidoreductase
VRIVPWVTRISVIGGGNIGETLGEAWRRAGHDVVYVARSPEPPRTVAIADAIDVVDGVAGCG